MKPRGILMTEHRLIERMIVIIQKEIAEIERGRQIDKFTINPIIDFMRFYADQTHHGKEENILFRQLAKKEMTEEDSKLMAELIDEHKFARTATEDIINAEEKFFKGQNTIGIIITTFNSLVRLYPRHIQKEDDIFFPNSETYLTDEELEAMVTKFEDFDRTMIHKKYKSLIEQFEE
ncbi:MAG: hypothetical protein A2Y10_18290 [Planctomycetes bacterium GWF2_41_51]|nr:MAG: hypothetical protein A2Y10_18290 [Planctomycetes bacterium GWF2_41_51]HBG27941.1 cation-binding protein [Phycisphaerales bacterium]